MKHKVHWAYEVLLEQVKKALAKDKDDMSKAAEILRSISPEEAHRIIHDNDGYVVMRTIRVVYYNMKHNKYDKEKFKDLYAAFLDIDEEYTANKAFGITKLIIRAEPVECPPFLF